MNLSVLHFSQLENEKKWHFCHWLAGRLMQWLLIRLSNDLWSSNSPLGAAPSRGCLTAEQTNRQRSRSNFPNGSQSAVEPRTGLWLPRTPGPCRCARKEMRSPWGSAAVLTAGITASSCTGKWSWRHKRQKLIMSRIYVSRRAEPMLLFRLTHLQTLLVCSFL